MRKARLEERAMATEMAATLAARRRGSSPSERLGLVYKELNYIICFVCSGCSARNNEQKNDAWG